MKKFILVLLLPMFSFSQEIKEFNGGEFRFNPNNIPCITEEAIAKINAEIEINVAYLKKQGKLSVKKSSMAAPSFIWPVKKSAISTYNDVWAISNYVDHDNAAGIEDYNCTQRTYNSHTGTDIFTWPFSWYQMENNISEVIAAAAGIIVFKNDGLFDKSCDLNSNNWNAVYLEHSDGSRTWYGHLKNGSLTSKSVGDDVVEGEYLGVVGSSGNSTGPHLHFEVYDSNNKLIDPFNGNCNNIATWWQDQPDYRDPQINAALTHTAPPVFNTCPEIETTNTANKFLPNSDIYLAGYFKDQLVGTTVFLKLYNPNGTNIEWSQNLINTFGSSYWYWIVDNLSALGTYKFEITYQGQKVTHEFEVATTLAVEDEKLAKISVSPNPFGGQLKISGFSFEQENFNMTVFNQLGQKVYDKDMFSDQLDLLHLSSGMYFLNIGDKTSGGSKTFKIIKK